MTVCIIIGIWFSYVVVNHNGVSKLTCLIIDKNARRQIINPISIPPNANYKIKYILCSLHAIAFATSVFCVTIQYSSFSTLNYFQS